MDWECWGEEGCGMTVLNQVLKEGLMEKTSSEETQKDGGGEPCRHVGKNTAGRRDASATAVRWRLCLLCSRSSKKIGIE